MNPRLPAAWPFTRGELLAILLGFLITLPFVTTRIYASDEVQYFAWLRSFAFDRDVDFQNEYQYFHDAGAGGGALFHETFLERRNEAGRRENYGPIGSAVLWAPFYAIGHVTAWITGAPQDGYSQPYISAVAYGSAVYGTLAIVLSAATARRLTGRGIAASLIVAIGTPLVFYIYIAPPMSHANSAFAVALFLWIWLRVRDGWRPAGLALLGATGGLMAMVRDQDMFFVAGPALDFVRHWVTSARPEAGALRGRPSPVAAAAAVAAFVIAYAPQLLATSALHGHVGPSDVVTRKMTWTSPHALGVLMSPEHGFFAWTPLALIAIIGLTLLALGRAGSLGPARAATSARDVRWLATLLLVLVALQTYISGAVESWTVAGSFGQRRFVGLTAILTVGVAALLNAAAAANASRVGVRVLLVLCVWWNLGLLAQFGTNTMDRQRLTLKENAWRTFAELPREVPTLAWRYLTDRASFYKRPRN